MSNPAVINIDGFGDLDITGWTSLSLEDGSPVAIARPDKVQDYARAISSIDGLLAEAKRSRETMSDAATSLLLKASFERSPPEWMMVTVETLRTQVALLDSVIAQAEGQ